MPTRFYLSQKNSNIAPAFGTYTVTSNSRRVLETVVDPASIIVSKGSSSTSIATGTSMNRQYISNPMMPQILFSGSTITFTLKGLISTTTSNSGNPLYVLRKCNLDGSIVTEIVRYTTATNYTTSNTNRTLTVTLASNLVFDYGDRIVIEIGFSSITGTTSKNVTQDFGSSAASDLPANNTSAAISNPWIEFSQVLLFLSFNPMMLFAE